MLVDFLFMKSSRNKDLSYGENFINLINKVNSVSGNEMDFEEYIVFKNKPRYYDNFSKGLIEVFSKVLNNDLDWNIFFKILQRLLQESYSDILTEFIIFVRYEYTCELKKLYENKELPREKSQEFEKEVLSLVLEEFNKTPTLEFLMDKSLNKFRNVLCEINESESKSRGRMLKIFKDNYTF